MNAVSFILNALLFFVTLYIVASELRRDGRWNAERTKNALRFFTVLSNLFCALGAGVYAFCLLTGHVSQDAVTLRYLGTLCVTVTLLTVLLFLAPQAGGLKPLLTGANLYLHLIGPLLAIVDFLFFMTGLKAPGTYLWGILPVIAYGAFYLYRTRFAPESRRWPDFYGFNKGRAWPASYAVMVLGTLVLCVLFRFLKSI